MGSRTCHHDVVDEDAIAAAARCLVDGGLVAFPTETVYGLGADAANSAALRRLYRVKGRPHDHPSIVHLADAEDVHDGWVASWPKSAERLSTALWPGPLTILADAGTRAAPEILGGSDAVAIRVPDQPVARALIRAAQTSVAAPSANRFGRVSPTSADHVRADLGDDVDLILDDGPCAIGVESTIVDCRVDPPRLIRPGGVPRERLEEILGAPLTTTGDPHVRAPGTLPAHYAPHARVVIADDPQEITLLMGGGRVALLAPTQDLAAARHTDGAVVLLDAGPDAVSYAHRLYTLLREADRQGTEVVIAIPPSGDGLGAAVRDRLERAARGLSHADERT